MLLKLAETDIHRRFFFWFSPQNNIVFPQSIVELLGILNNSLTSMIIYRLKIHVSSSHQIKSFTWITNVIGTMSISVSMCYHCSFHIMVQLKQTISIKQWKTASNSITISLMWTDGVNERMTKNPIDMQLYAKHDHERFSNENTFENPVGWEEVRRKASMYKISKECYRNTWNTNVHKL